MITKHQTPSELLANQRLTSSRTTCLNYHTKMTGELVIRRPQATEYGLVQALIETVANETFKDLFAPNPEPLKFKDEDWPLSWVAVSDGRIVGVILTDREWVDDLWVLPQQRRRGVGGKLLAQGEAEIATRGYRTCRLRVVRSNTVAVQFYLRNGWQIAREFSHEKYQHPMLEIAKPIPQKP